MQEKQANNEAPALDKAELLWNDVAAVSDENCCFIICKTMLKLPEEKADVACLEETQVTDILGEFAQGELSGKIILAISYTDEEKQQQEVSLAVPFIIDYKGDLSRGSVLEENYAAAQRVDSRHILLETVTSVPKKNIPLRSLEKIGHFERKNRLLLPEGWPDMDQIIGANLQYDQAQFRAEDDQAILEMVGHIGIIYAQDTEEGEKVVYYQTDEPLSIALDQPLVEAEIAYYSLNAQIIDEREILLQSFNHLYGAKVQEEESTAAEEPAETAAPQAREEEPPKQDDIQPAPETTAAAADVKEEMPRSNTVPPRVNRRESLERHMHRLDQGVKTSHIVRNIDFSK